MQAADVPDALRQRLTLPTTSPLGPETQRCQDYRSMATVNSTTIAMQPTTRTKPSPTCGRQRPSSTPRRPSERGARTGDGTARWRRLMSASYSLESRFIKPTREALAQSVSEYPFFSVSLSGLRTCHIRNHADPGADVALRTSGDVHAIYSSSQPSWSSFPYSRSCPSSASRYLRAQSLSHRRSSSSASGLRSSSDPQVRARLPSSRFSLQTES